MTDQAMASGGERRRQRLAWALRVLALLDFAAVAAVIMPAEQIARWHDWAGLGVMPSDPRVAHLARVTSAWYVLHGALLWRLASDVVGQRGLIRWLAGLAIIHGSLMTAVDVALGMPILWTLAEGPCFAVIGLLLLHWSR